MGFGKDPNKLAIKSIHELLRLKWKHQNVQDKIVKRIINFLRKRFLLDNLQKFLLHITVQAEFL